MSWRSAFLVMALAGALVALAMRLPGLLGAPEPLPLEALPGREPDAAPVDLMLPRPPDALALEPALDRPPMHKDRRPFEAAVIEEDAPPEPARPVPRLRGIVSSGDERVALFSEPGDMDAQPVRVGDLIGGWRVLSISDEAVRLSRDAQDIEVTIDFGLQ